MHATLRITGGVNTTRTPALNEAGISDCDLIRYSPGSNGDILPQKLGGWDKFFGSAVQAIVRALWAWEDTNDNTYLAAGAETSATAGVGAPLLVINEGNARDITPQVLSHDQTPNITTVTTSNVVTVTDTGYSTATTAASGTGTTATISFAAGHTFHVGQSIVVAGVTPAGYNATATITAVTSTSVSYLNATTGVQTVAGTVSDNGSNISRYVSVFVQTHVSIGGVLVFGFYQCTGASSTTYTVPLVDVLGDPVYPTGAATGGVVAEFTTSSGTALINVELPDHGFSVGTVFPILIPTTVGGITLFGNYLVQAVVDVDNFTIFAANSATSSTSAFINGGLARYHYYIGQGPLPAGTGYGVGGYGTGGYGSGTAPSGIVGDNLEAGGWSLDNWGEILIASPDDVTFGAIDTNPVGGPIYTWSPLANDPIALVIPQAPVANHGCFVAMPQRQIIAWGSTFNGIQDPLLLRWSDIGSYTVWAPRPENQARSFRLPKGSRIVGGIQGPQQGYIWTDLAVWSMQYVNLPGVYSINEIGTGCGLIAKRAAANLNGIVYWMGQSQFFTLSGDGVAALPCPVWDVIFQELDTDNLDKIRVAPNSRFNEIAWYYPTTASNGEIAAYVKYNTLVQQWDFGSLARTAWINESVLGPPIGAGVDRYIYQHETSPDADGQPLLARFRTGYFQLSEAELMIFVDQVWPDMKWGYYNGTQNAAVQLTFYVVNYPGDTPVAHGPYTLTQAVKYVTPRFRNRLVSIEVESSDVGTWWRMGALRYRLKPDGFF